MAQYVDNPWFYLSEIVLHSTLTTSDSTKPINEGSNVHLKISSVAVCEDHNIIASATTDGSITVYVKKDKTSNGRINVTDFTTKCFLSDQDDEKDTSFFTQLCWQGGVSTNLVCGRGSGQIVYIDALPTKDLDTDRINELILLDSNKDIHQHEIVDFQWSENHDRNEPLRRLLSVDRSGCCCLWKTELDVALIPVTKYHNDCGISATSFVDSLFLQNDQQNNFLFALDNGGLYHANELGRCNEITLEEKCDRVKIIKHYDQEVILITRSSQLIQMKVVDGSFTPTRHAKIHMDIDFTNDVLLTRDGQLICMTTKGTVHCFDMESSENYQIKLKKEEEDNNGKMVRPLSISIGIPPRNVLSICLSNSKACFFKLDESTKKWVLARFANNISTISPNESSNTSCAFAGDIFCVYKERYLACYVKETAQCTYSNDVVALQTGSSSISLFNESDMGAFVSLDAGIKIKGLSMDTFNLCIWSNEEIQLYKIEGCGNLQLYSEMCMKVESVTLHADSLYIAKDNTLIITDLYGVQRLTINLPVNEGMIQHLHSSADVLSLVTYSGTLKIFDVSQKEPKLLSVKNQVFQDIYSVDLSKNLLSFRCNSDGSIVSLISEHYGSQKLHFYFTGNGCIVEAEPIAKRDCYIMSHGWDSAFASLFTCEIRNQVGEVNCITALVSQDDICIHEDFKLCSSSQCIGICAPVNLYLSKSSISSDFSLRRKILEGFEDVDVSNAEDLSTLVDFFFFINTGHLDKACFALQSSRTCSKCAWNRLAQATVINNRLEIAKLCVMKIGNGIGVASIRKVPEDVAMAEVAIQLGMYKEAEEIYRAANRFDLICELSRRQGLHEEASEADNRLSATNTNMLNVQIKKQKNYSDRHVVLNMNTGQSERKSRAAKKSILAKMIKRNETVDIFLRQENDVDLYKYYSRYLENIGYLSEAKKIYSAIRDYTSLVRIACVENDLNTAFHLVQQSDSKGGAYHLARYLEANGDIKGALDCFARSGMYNYAIRLAKSFEMHTDILHFALKSEIPKAIECSNYLENAGCLEMTAEILLSIKFYEDALKIIAMLPLDEKTARLKSEVLSIADTLDLDKSEKAVKDCASIMLKSGMHKNAIELLQKSCLGIDEALKFLAEKDVIFNEVIIEVITSCFDKAVDKAQFILIANLCKGQGNHILACKMYTQGGDRSNAVKCLLNTGDTKKILAYAFTSRSREVYIMVANHLQKLDYYHSEEIKRALLQLYTKAKSNEHIARLMISWSLFEAADGEYELSHKWLLEAQRNSKDSEGKKTMSFEELKWISKNLDALQVLQEAQKSASTDTLYAEKLCKQIISNHESNDLIQLGDCYAFLVQIQIQANKAIKLIEEMQQRGLVPLDYIEKEVIEQIQKATMNY